MYVFEWQDRDVVQEKCAIVMSECEVEDQGAREVLSDLLILIPQREIRSFQAK
jgi:hypothetical protein